MLAAVLTDGGFLYGEKMSECYVYIMRSGHGDGPIKIGVASNPEKRIAGLQVGNPVAIILLTKILMPNRKAAYDLEWWLHKRFNRNRMEVEWFHGRSCNIKMALELYPNFDATSRRERVGPMHIYGHGKTKQIEELKHENYLLKLRIEELEKAIEES